MYYKAYKFRIYPNENQRTLINKTLGCTRFVYNYFLNMLKENGYKKYKDLNERIYKCPKCHLEIDRDLNASINIMFEGAKIYMKNYCSNY